MIVTLGHHHFMQGYFFYVFPFPFLSPRRLCKVCNMQPGYIITLGPMYA